LLYAFISLRAMPLLRYAIDFFAMPPDELMPR
jgi:hypothetical protein